MEKRTWREPLPSGSCYGFATLSPARTIHRYISLSQDSDQSYLKLFDNEP